MLNKKHMLTLAAASAMALGASSLSAAPVLSNNVALKDASADGITQVRYKHRKSHARLRQSQDWQAAGPFGAPFAAAAGVGAATGAVVGGALSTAGAVVGGVTGYPYGPYAYDNAYGSYAYAPNGYGYGGYGLSTDIGHAYYNGGAAPASQDNCAVDGGYGRRDYSAAC